MNNKTKHFMIIHPQNYQEINPQRAEVDAMDISDDYHTMDELYDHRRALTAALLNTINQSNIRFAEGERAWKSKLHSDGTMFEGYFICGLTTLNGLISYHYELQYWEQFRVPEMERAPEYDGHTSQDVIERLLKL